SNHAGRDKHLSKTDFLDVDTFPKATFVSKKVEPAGDGQAKITGDLTLRGLTKEVVIDAAYVGGGPDPWGGNRVGFAGTTSVPLADFGITFNLGPASKEVELTLNVEGVEKK
ncbi:MAG: YceI family protein, partial [Rhizobiales bacterium]|nr:YceI family protein [Hyphomicrobiales bacterium]